MLDHIAGKEAYSFTDGFSGYHQVRITEEDKNKMTSATKWVSYAYNVMPFGFKNAPVVFSKIVTTTFRDYIHKFLEVYLDDWRVYNLLKDQVAMLRIMFERCASCRFPLICRSAFSKLCLVYFWVMWFVEMVYWLIKPQLLLFFTYRILLI